MKSHKSWVSVSGLAAGVLLVGLSPVHTEAAPGERYTLLVGSVVMPDGTLSGMTRVSVADGRISDVRAESDGAAPAGLVLERRQAVLCPGMVDVLSGLGVARRGNHIERVQAIDPGLGMRDAVDRTHPDFQRALECGVTAALVVPAGNNVIGGAAQAVRLAAGGQIEWLRDPGPLMFSLGTSVLESTREPTGRLGAVHLLRESLDSAADSSSSSRVRDFLKNSLDGLLVCEEEEDVIGAARVFQEKSRLPLLAWSPLDAAGAVELVKPFADPLVLLPLTFESSARVLHSAGVLQQSGRELAFAGILPYLPGDSMRVSASLAVSYGMEPSAARRAITVNPARAAGVTERIGSIQAGKDADFVVFSADPLRLDARVLEVYVKGVKVYDASLH